MFLINSNHLKNISSNFSLLDYCLLLLARLHQHF